MTTPERLKRRQLIEGAMLIVIGLAMLWQSWYFAGQADEQRQCLVDNFQELSVALDARGDLAERESAQNKALWSIYAEAAGLVRDDPTEELPPREQAKLQRRLVAQLLEYDRVMDDIADQRRSTPLPPYPAGQCGD
jgi:hypothetical protein